MLLTAYGLFICAYCLPAAVVTILWWLITPRRVNAICVALAFTIAFLAFAPRVQANPPLWTDPLNGLSAGLSLAFCIGFYALCEFAFGFVSSRSNGNASDDAT